MKLAAVKKLVESNSIDELKAAEEAILDEKKPEIAIEGDDEGEQLTHVIAAQWVLNRVATGKVDVKTALREYTSKVRESIS